MNAEKRKSGLLKLPVCLLFLESSVGSYSSKSDRKREEEILMIRSGSYLIFTFLHVWSDIPQNETKQNRDINDN